MTLDQQTTDRNPDSYENHINGFNTQNNELFLSAFGDTAIIIDGIAPSRWLNPNAPANWIADSDKWRKDLGVSYENLSYEMGFWNVESSNAYAVISGSSRSPLRAKPSFGPPLSSTHFQSMAMSGRSMRRRGGGRRRDTTFGP